MPRRLPVHALGPCPRCRYPSQGTTAKAGNSVRCTECGLTRRVSASRSTSGPDATGVIVPKRGRPFKDANPYRFRSDAEDDPQTRSDPKIEDRKTGWVDVDTNPRVPPEGTEDETAEWSPGLWEIFCQVIEMLIANPTVAPKFTTDTGDGKDTLELEQLAEFWDREHPGSGITWKMNKKAKSIQFQIQVEESESEPEQLPISEPTDNDRLNCRYGNHTWYQTPGTMTVECLYCHAKPEADRPTYVNPDTCPHNDAAYDYEANAYRCPHCSLAWQ
jgi:hypothetical protein